MSEYVEPTLLSEYFSNHLPGWTAKVCRDVDVYLIEYYDEHGRRRKVETFEGKSIHYVEDAAENWALGIKRVPGLPSVLCE